MKLNSYPPLARPCPASGESRRDFLKHSLALVPLALGMPPLRAAARPSKAKVALATCTGYGPEIQTALRRCLDLLGGIGGLVNNKTVTVKINLTGTDFSQWKNRAPGETFMTHFATVRALGALLFEAGARRVRWVESTNSKARLEETLKLADWDVNALLAQGKVEFENTRNLGSFTRYASLKVPDGGRLFTHFELNGAYAETDVVISLCKLKQHICTGVTLSLKNLFGITPNALYGDEGGNENATAGRGPMHYQGTPGCAPEYARIQLPGHKTGVRQPDQFARVPRVIVDLCAARPIHLSIIDGITTMSGGEGPWCRHLTRLDIVQPGLILAGLDPIATDAIGAYIMGADNPRGSRGNSLFEFCDNHLLLAEEAGLGTADLNQIEALGLALKEARRPFPSLRPAR